MTSAAVSAAICGRNVPCTATGMPSDSLRAVCVLALVLSACGAAEGSGAPDGSGSGTTGPSSAGGSVDASTAGGGGESSPGTVGTSAGATDATSGGTTGSDAASGDTGTTGEEDTGETESDTGETEGDTGETEGDTGEDPWSDGDPDDPFAFASCGGDPLTPDDVLSLMGPGETSAELGAYRVFHRSRECNRLTGCTAWSVSTPHFATQRVDEGALFGGSNRPPVGDTSVSINPDTADVELRFGNQGWCTQVVDGQLGSPCDIEPLLLPPAAGGSWTVEPGLLRRNCFMFRAHGVEPIEGSVNEREFEVVLRGDHAIDRADVSAELLAHVASAPESLICWGHTHNPASCSPHFDNYSTQMWDLSATFQPGSGSGLGSVIIDVPQFDLVSATVELDEDGYGVFSAPVGSNGIRVVRASLGEGVLIVESSYAPNFQGTCVAGQDWSCAGVYSTGI
ncbi:MAG: hypothetical protein ACE37F_32205 [Nannocystaceae bacterium]|nr:hypothetical protein [bacterium]